MAFNEKYRVIMVDENGKKKERDVYGRDLKSAHDVAQKVVEDGESECVEIYHGSALVAELRDGRTYWHDGV
jgi:hypothetical protein